jgi:hypothetical protein
MTKKTCKQYMPWKPITGICYWPSRPFAA